MSMDSKVPVIRFKGFSTNWPNFNLSQITDVYDGTHQTPAYTKSGVMFLSAENIKSLTSTKFISEEAFKKEFKVYPKKNDVLMTRIGDVGTANVVETDDDRAYYVTLALLKYKKINPYFLKSSIASPFVQKDIWLRTLHIAFPKKINMNEIKQVAVNCPSDAVESEKIGQYFKNLDALITQHQQKHDKIRNIKKSMLEKMFPKQGETIPEIRFKGFSGEWEEREFSDIATRISTHHQSTLLPCVEYEDIVAGKGRLNKDIHQKKTFKAGLKFEADDVLFGKLRPYLKNWFLADFEGLAVGDFWVLRANNVASTFLFSLIQTNGFELISNLSAGSKMPRSDWGLVSSSCFFVPKNISESNEIGSYFQKLDALINQHQQQITKLNNIKQACLSKMFF